MLGYEVEIKYNDILPTPTHCRPTQLCLPSRTIVVRIPVGDAPFEYEIRIRWRTTHTSVYVCLNWPLYGNGPGAAHWKRIDSTRCVSRIGVTLVGRFASGCFRSKGFNIKPRPRLASPARLRPSGMGTWERQCGVFAESISSVYVSLFFFRNVTADVFI